MRILCLAADASSNSIVRVAPIAKTLERNHDVHMAGFRSRDHVFAPYADAFDYHTLRTRPLPGFLRQVGELADRVAADIVLAFKPLSTSLWTGLAVRQRLRIPLLVDIEDWELGWYLDRPPAHQLRHLARIDRANGMAWTAVNERLVRRADGLFVASEGLRRRFGGTLLPHGPDTSCFDPRRWSREEALDRLGLDDAEYVVFTGSAMPSKGLEDVLEALRELARPGLRLLVVGSFQHDPAFRDRLLARYGDLLEIMPPRPHAEMPLFLAVATLVVLAQRRSRETEAQVPAKVYEAMAMARPVVATAVGDLPAILDGCGCVVAPGDPRALREALERLLEERDAGERLGAAARRRCEERYGWDAMERILEPALHEVTRA
jgi:glycosyltransferase involved in cell wall biosynthesis